LVLQVHVRRSINQKAGDETASQEKDVKSNLAGGNGLPRVRKSKLLVVDLAGSERLDKSGMLVILYKSELISVLLFCLAGPSLEFLSSIHFRV
jgi:hypothetical protein